MPLVTVLEHVRLQDKRDREVVLDTSPLLALSGGIVLVPYVFRSPTNENVNTVPGTDASRPTDLPANIGKPFTLVR